MAKVQKRELKVVLKEFNAVAMQYAEAEKQGDQKAMQDAQEKARVLGEELKQIPGAPPVKWSIKAAGHEELKGE